MPLPAIWRDEAGFRRAALRLAAGGGLGATLAAASSDLVPGAGVLLAWFPWALAACAHLAGTAREPLSIRATTFAALAAAAALLSGRWPALAGDAAGAALAGAAAGLSLALALAPVYVRLLSPRIVSAVHRARRALRASGHEELARLLDDARALWTRAEAGGAALAGVRRPLAAAVLRLATIGERHAALGLGRDLPERAALCGRLAALAARAEACRDPIARRELADVRRSLETQVRHRDAIAAAAERVEARFHAHVASMEALHLAALGLGSADAAGHAAALRPMIETLERLGEDMELGRAAVEEGEATARSP